MRLNKQKYMPAAERALNMSKSYKELYFIEHEKYNQKDYNKLPNYRETDKKKLIQPALKYTCATTKQKVAESIRQSERYSLEPANEKMRFNPRFRENHREKWMSKSDFKMGYKNKEIKPLKNYSPEVHDPFMGGKEKVLAMTSRPLDKSKNVSDVEFSSVISKDPFQYKRNNLSSLRSYGNINATIIKTGITADISSFVKQRKSLNISKSLSKLVDIKKDNNETIQEILADFGQTAGKTCKIKSQLQGTQNKRYKVVKDLDDSDILDLLTHRKKIYHMSAYEVVKEPEIVLRNRNKPVDKIPEETSTDFLSRQIELQSNADSPLMGLYASETFDQVKSQQMKKQLEDIRKQEKYVKLQNEPESPVGHIDKVTQFRPRRVSMEEISSNRNNPLNSSREEFAEAIKDLENRDKKAFRKTSTQINFPKVQVCDHGLDDRIINDIDLATYDNDFLNKVEVENNEGKAKVPNRSGFYKEKPMLKIAPVEKSSFKLTPRRVPQDKELKNNESFGSGIRGPHEDGGCQNTSLISIPDMLKNENNERSRILLQIYKNPQTKPESIRKLIDG